MEAIMKEAFGDSSDSEDDHHHHHHHQLLNLEDSYHECQSDELIFGESPTWEPIPEINGLWLCINFLSPQQQSSLLSSIQKEGWFTESSHNQAMRFGDLPAWATELSNSIRCVIQFSDYVSEHMDVEVCDEDKVACLFPSELLWREPLFNQLIVNTYQPGEGICAHVDLMRFEDGITIVSLESPCVMHFSRVENETSSDTEKEANISTTKIGVYLNPGSLVLMWGEARYLWKHEINRKPGFQKWQGREIDQKRRTSITLRKLCRSE